MKFALLQFGLLGLVSAAAQPPACKAADATCKNVPAASAKPCSSLISKAGLKVTTCQPARKTNTVTKTVKPTVTVTKTIQPKTVTNTVPTTLSVRPTITQPTTTIINTAIADTTTTKTEVAFATITTVVSTDVSLVTDEKLATATTSTTKKVAYPLETCGAEPVHPEPPKNGTMKFIREELGLEDRAAQLPKSCSCFLTATAATLAPTTTTITVKQPAFTVTKTVVAGNAAPTKTVQQTITITKTQAAITLPRPLKTITTTKTVISTKAVTTTSTSSILSTTKTTSTKTTTKTTTTSVTETETADPCVDPLLLSNRNTDKYSPESSDVTKTLYSAAHDQYACCRYCFGLANCAFFSVSPYDEAAGQTYCNVFVAKTGAADQCKTGKCPNGKPNTSWGAADPDNDYFAGVCW